MFTVEKTFEVSAAHMLKLPYESKCQNLHGHNWIITVTCQSQTLNASGMVMDFTHIKNNIQDKLDHQYINDIIQDNPTAENMAKWIAEQIGDKCKKVSVQESEGNVATYEI